MHMWLWDHDSPKSGGMTMAEAKIIWLLLSYGIMWALVGGIIATKLYDAEIIEYKRYRLEDVADD